MACIVCCVYVLCVFFSLPFYYFSPICAFRRDFFHLNLYLFKYVYLEFTTCNWRVCVLNRWLLWLVSNVILRRVYLPKLERTELKLKMQSNAEHINVCWRYLDSLSLSLSFTHQFLLFYIHERIFLCSFQAIFALILYLHLGSEWVGMHFVCTLLIIYIGVSISFLDVVMSIHNWIKEYLQTNCVQRIATRYRF